jgi:hypothetical protein
MRKASIVFGFLVAFLLATLEAYAAEDNTWGRIKASFGNLEYVDNTSPALAKKPPKAEANSSAAQEEPTADYPQSSAYTATWWARRDVYRGGALDLPNGSVFNFVAGSLTPPPDTPYGEPVTITMTCEKDVVADELVFSFGPSGCAFNPAARVWLSYSDLGIEVPTLYHIDDQGNYTEQEPDDIDYTGQWVVLYIHHFSRYALSRCR